MHKELRPVSCADIALRASARWITRGQPAGTHLQDWQEAEADLRPLQIIVQQLANLQQGLRMQTQHYHELQLTNQVST